MTNDELFVIGLVAAVGILLVVAVSFLSGKRRKRQLRERFGPEYDRVLAEEGNERRAEQVLAARARRVQGLRLHELDAAHRVQFSADWAHAQTRFVDEPALAVQEADELIQNVLAARGYPRGTRFEQRVADLSVELPQVVQHYRAAHALADSHERGQTNTEELRLALVHYRELFAALLEAPQRTSEPSEKPLHAARGAV